MAKLRHSKVNSIASLKTQWDSEAKWDWETGVLWPQYACPARGQDMTSKKKGIFYWHLSASRVIFQKHVFESWRLLWTRGFSSMKWEHMASFRSFLFFCRKSSCEILTLFTVGIHGTTVSILLYTHSSPLILSVLIYNVRNSSSKPRKVRPFLTDPAHSP